MTELPCIGQIEEHLAFSEDAKIEITSEKPVRSSWNRWEDAGGYPNNVGYGPLPNGPWQMEQIICEFSVTFKVPAEWVVEMEDGYFFCTYDFDEREKIVDFLNDNRDRTLEITEEIFEKISESEGLRCLRDGPAHNNLYEDFVPVFDNVEVKVEGDEANIKIRVTLEYEQDANRQ